MSDRRPRVAVALPAKDEAAHLPACLSALDRAAGHYGGRVSIAVVANNSCDDSAALLDAASLCDAALHGCAVTLLPPFAHAGWARRLAFDAAAALLSSDQDVLLSTDADTCVAADWITRTVAHLRDGATAVAGRALTRREDRAALGPRAMRRLNLLGRYYTALDWLRADVTPVPHDPWPRHFYEGGASIALTLGTYRAIGGAPTPPLAEDRALFGAIRDAGGLVRHPLDVRVFTSSRTSGRAPGGMADAVARWIAQDDDEPLHETYGFPAALDPDRATSGDRLSFATLPGAIAGAVAIIRGRRSRATPHVETVFIPPFRADHLDLTAEQRAQAVHGIVA